MKGKRQAKIKEIISAVNVETQEQLQQELLSAGYSCTQATISRDIRELGLVKELTNLGSYRYTAPEKESTSGFAERLNTIFRECVISAEYAQNIIVIHTLPGLANAAGSTLDGMHLNMILGTLAGDDTVIVIMRDNNSAASFNTEIHKLMGK